jgi:F-type H+-transporting ATPase subunit delta
VEEIAQVYARSLFEVAKEHDELDEIHDQLGEFADALDESRELQMFFFSPYFSSEEKKEGIDKVVDGANERFLNFLKLIAERHRVPAIFRIRREYDGLWRQENRLLEVRVTSAMPLDDETVKSIGQRIEEQTGQRIDLDANVDPDVIGGLVLRVGNLVMDASVRGRLERLRKEVARAA